MQKADIVVVGAGAAGLMAAIAAARTAPGRRVVALDGAARLGAKILIAGGGRCNVTHHAVTERDFNGSTPPAIRRILRGFTVDDTIAFFAAAGVDLKREPTGKLFPVSDQARDVLRALLDAASGAGVEVRQPCRVTGLERLESSGGATEAPTHFRLETSDGPWLAGAIVLATGGQSVPKTGSDGSGYGLVTRLGVPLTPRRFPALVPLTLPAGHVLTGLAGLATDVALTVVSGTGRHLHEVTGALLCTHQGLSGPAVLDVSRHWQEALHHDAGAGLLVRWMPGVAPDALDGRLQQHGRRPVVRALAPPLPDRLAEAICRLADVASDQPAATLPRDARKRLVAAASGYRLPVTGTRGFAVAEVTAGGVPLAALTATLEARACAGLFICGELCDVDGRIGGFNFQWAWASGWAAGRAAAGTIGEMTGRRARDDSE